MMPLYRTPDPAPDPARGAPRPRSAVAAGAETRGAIPEGAMCLLRCLVVCDLAESTALFERLGDQRAAELIRRHDRLVRDLIREHGGQEIDKTDGFLAMFERPVQAVGFALACQRELRRFSADEGVNLAARIGIHVGEVVLWQNSAEDVAKGAKPVEVEGLVKPVAARLMALALPGQILLSGVAYSIAHRAEGELGAVLARMRWRAHGRFRFKGVPDAVPVYEVGEEGVAPLRAPAWSGKAHREIPFWRRPLMLAAETVLLLALVTIPLWHVFRPPPAIAFAERDWVIVGDLRNLTGDSRFDESLQEAFRIGLEQSRHVNVLSSLQVGSALERMQRPAGTRLDRATGSELARREGARALILPTLSEVGGRVRFTAEVVDPVTRATVYAESADGAGAASVLASVDRVNRQLRSRLGEALVSITEDSLPLEKVATADFDALRAYTMAVQAMLGNRYNDALALLRQAINIDPEFGRARIELSDLLTVVGDRAGALLELHRAIEKPERLSVRDRLYANASIANLSDSPARAIERWRLLANLYPDDFRAQGALGYYLWYYGNRYAEAIEAIRRNVHPANPNRSTGHYLLGLLYLGQERYDEAIEQFRESEALGRRFENIAFASAHAARNEFTLAQRALARGIPGSPLGQYERTVVTATFKLDQGNWAGARLDLDSAGELPGLGAPVRQTLAAIQSGLDVLAGTPGEARDALARLQRLLADAGHGGDDPLWMADHEQHHLLLAWLAARMGDAAMAQRALARLSLEERLGEYPVLWQWRELVDAELLRAQGRPAAAVEKLRRIGDDDDRLYLVRVSLLDALADDGQHEAALEEARWLAEHRGRAYAENVTDMLLVPLNVAHSRLAWLYQAEQAIHLGRVDVATEALDRFVRYWQPDRLPAPLQARLQAARRALSDLDPGDDATDPAGNRSGSAQARAGHAHAQYRLELIGGKVLQEGLEGLPGRKRSGLHALVIQGIDDVGGHANAGQRRARIPGKPVAERVIPG